MMVCTMTLLISHGNHTNPFAQLREDHVRWPREDDAHEIAKYCNFIRGYLAMICCMALDSVEDNDHTTRHPDR
jgi:hypothetical protein